MSEPESAPEASRAIGFWDAFRVWLKIGLLGFGGPAGQIALLQRIIVDEKRWISERRFLHALNYCMLLPGPEAQQLAIYLGWLLHRTLGGLAAGILFVLPGALVILTLSIFYVSFRELSVVDALFFGIKAAVFAVVIEAVLRIGKRALTNSFMVALAVASFICIFFFNLPFPLIIFAAAGIGFAGARVNPDIFANAAPHAQAPAGPIDAVLDRDGLTHIQPTLARACKIILVSVALWFAPVIGVAVWQGGGSVLVTQALFFSKMAVVTFGGAYAVLAYVAQQAVETYAWLSAGEMLDGLGLAETTPGPLILVLQFVGFLAAYRDPGALDPMFAGVLGAMLTTWVTFVPCFLWIFLGAPYIEALRGNAALSAITAAVVGVIAYLAVWFGLHVMFDVVDEIHQFGMRLFVPVWETFNPAALVLAVGALVAMLRYRLGMIRTLAGAAALGAIYSYAAQ